MIIKILSDGLALLVSIQVIYILMRFLNLMYEIECSEINCMNQFLSFKALFMIKNFGVIQTIWLFRIGKHFSM